MNNDLKILITGSLNVGKSIGEINTAIRGIEQKIKHLKLKIEVDDKVFNTLKSFTQQLSKISDSARNAGKVIEEALLPDGTKVKRTYFDGLNNEFSETVTQAKKASESIDKHGKEVGDLTDKYQKLTKEQIRYNKEAKEIGRSQTLKNGNDTLTIRKDSQGIVQGFSESKNPEKEMIEQQKLIEQMANFREQSLLRRRQEEQKAEEAQRQAINRNAELERQEIAKTQQARESYENWWNQAVGLRDKKEKDEIGRLEHKLKLYKEQAEINVSNMKRKYKDSDIDTKGLDEYLEKVKKLKIDPFDTSKVTKDMDNLGMSFKKLSADVKVATSHTLSFGQQMKIAFDRTLIWSSVMTGIYGTIHAFQAMTREVLLIDEAMTELKRVMDEAPVTYNNLLHESIQLSKDLGNNVHEILAAVNGFARAGEYTQAQLLDLAKTVTVASNVSDLNAEEAMENLISVMNVYKIAAADTIDVVDKMNEVDNNFAVSTKQISDAMAKSSGVAASFGVSIDELIGDITSIASVTFESGSIIGRALKTIYSRITTMDGAADILNSVGISIKNMAGDNREVADILTDLRGKWDGLSNAQQQNIAVTLAGRDQLTRFIAMMNSADIAIAATETSLNSQGSAVRENEKYLESMGAQINKLKSSFTEMSVVVGENGLAQAFMAIVKTLTFMANGFSAFTSATRGLNIILPALALAIYGAVKAFAALRIAATGAKLSLGWIGLGVIALEGLATAGFGASRALGETVDTLVKSSNGYTQTADKLEQLVAQYDELKPQAETSTKAQEKLNGVLDEINRIAPSVIGNTDKYGNALDINKEKVDQFTQSLRTMSDEQLSNATVKLTTDFSQAKNELDSLYVKQKEARESFGELYDFMVEYQKKYNVTSMVEAANEYATRTAGLSGKALRNAANEFGQFNLVMTKHNVELEDYSTLLTDIENKEAEVKGLQDKSKQIDFLTNDYKELAETAKKTFDGKINSNVFGDFDKSQLKALIEFGNQINKNKGKIENYTHILTEAKLTQEQIENVINALTESAKLNGEVFDENADLMGENKEQIDELVKAYEDAVSAISSLNGIMNELNDKQGISAESIQLLMEKYPDLLMYLDDEKTLRIKLQEQIEKEAEVARQAMLDKLSDNTSFYNAMLKNNSTMVNQFATDYGIDLKNFTSLAKAKAEVDNEVRSRMSTAWNDYYQNLMKKANGTLSLSVDGQAPLAVKLGYGSEGAKGTPYYDAFKDAEKISSDFDAITSGYVKTLTGSIPKNGLEDPDDKKDTKKDRKSDSRSTRADAPVSQYISSEFKKGQDTYNDQLDASEHKVSKLKDSTEAYRKELSKQIPIIKNLMTVNDKEGKRLTKRNADIDNIIKGVMKGRKFDALNNDEKTLINNLTKEKEENNSTVKSLTSNNRDLADSIIEVNKSIADSKLAELTEAQEKAAKKIAQIQQNYANTQAKFDKQIIDSQRRQSMAEVGSDKWEAELKLQNEIHQKKIKFTLLEREELKKALRTENLSADEKANLKKRVDELSISYGELTDAIRDNEQTLLDAKEEMADKVIDTVKKAIETERDLKLAAIDDELDALEKLHNEKLRMIDKEENARDYNKDLSKMQKEQLALQTQISRLSMDDSQEAKAKRLELQKQLAELMEQIDEKQHDRSIELEKEGLQDSYDLQKDALDDERKLTDRKYSEQLNNERYFAKLREEIIEGNLTNIEGLLGGFLTNFQSMNEKVAEQIGVSWQGLLNIIDAVKSAQSDMGLPVGNTPTSPSTGGNTGGSGNSNTGKKGHLVTGTFKNGLDASNLVDILELQFGADAKLADENGLYRVEAEFDTLKRAEDVLKRLLDRKLISTGRVFHEGGIVGGKGSRLAELANKMFNSQDGMLIKSLPGELQIPPKNIPNIFSSISGMISGLIPKGTNNDVTYHLNVNIAKVEGGEKGAETLIKSINNKLKGMGVNI